MNNKTVTFHNNVTERQRQTNRQTGKLGELSNFNIYLEIYFNNKIFNVQKIMIVKVI